MRVRVTRIQGEFHRGCRGSVPSTFRMVASCEPLVNLSADTRNSCQSARFFFACHVRFMPHSRYPIRSRLRGSCVRAQRQKTTSTHENFIRSVTRMQPPPRAWRVCARNKCLAWSNRTETIRRQRNDRMFSLIPCRVTRI